jgi:hypothetical protein
MPEMQYYIQQQLESESNPADYDLPKHLRGSTAMLKNNCRPERTNNNKMKNKKLRRELEDKEGSG